MDKCHRCGGRVHFHGIKTMECVTEGCKNYAPEVQTFAPTLNADFLKGASYPGYDPGAVTVQRLPARPLGVSASSNGICVSCKVAQYQPGCDLQCKPCYNVATGDVCQRCHHKPNAPATTVCVTCNATIKRELQSPVLGKAPTAEQAFEKFGNWTIHTLDDIKKLIGKVKTTPCKNCNVNASDNGVYCAPCNRSVDSDTCNRCTNDLECYNDCTVCRPCHHQLVNCLESDEEIFRKYGKWTE